MNRFEYLDALRDALFGLPEATVAAIMADYERRFAERSSAGQSEEEIMASLGDPKKVAAEKRAAVQFNTFKEKKSLGNLVRLFFSLVGLMVFNLFMLVPGIVYMSLLFAAYVVSLVFYGSGILVTAASLADVSGMALHDPFQHEMVERHVKAFDKDELLIQHQSAAANAASSASASASASVPANKGSATATAAKSAAKDTKTVAKDAGTAVKDAGKVVADATDKQEVSDWNNSIDHSHLRVGNINIDDSGIQIHDAEDEDMPRIITLGTDFLDESRPAQVAIGILMILSGIIMFLLCLVVSKLTWAGLCRLAQMEFSVLKNA